MCFNSWWNFCGKLSSKHKVACSKIESTCLNFQFPFRFFLNNWSVIYFNSFILIFYGLIFPIKGFYTLVCHNFHHSNEIYAIILSNCYFSVGSDVIWHSASLKTERLRIASAIKFHSILETRKLLSFLATRYYAWNFEWCNCLIVDELLGLHNGISYKTKFNYFFSIFENYALLMLFYRCLKIFIFEFFL